MSILFVIVESVQSSIRFFRVLTLCMFGQGMNPVIRADGSPRFAMASTLTIAVLNIILDAMFIFVFKGEMMGAAVATVLGQAVTALCGPSQMDTPSREEVSPLPSWISTASRRRKASSPT